VGEGEHGSMAVSPIGGDKYAIDIRGHRVRVDQPLNAGDDDTAPTPTELFVATDGWRCRCRPGFHVTTAAYCRFVEANALQAVIAEATANAQSDDPASVQRASAAVRRLFWSGAAPEPVPHRDPRRLHQPRRGRADGGGAGGGRWAHRLPQKTSLCSPS
jgi:Pyruvate phosphate dikinase, AMP/ATP-binding domain